MPHVRPLPPIRPSSCTSWQCLTLTLTLTLALDQAEFMHLMAVVHVSLKVKNYSDVHVGWEVWGQGQGSVMVLVSDPIQSVKQAPCM